MTVGNLRPAPFRVCSALALLNLLAAGDLIVDSGRASMLAVGAGRFHLQEAA